MSQVSKWQRRKAVRRQRRERGQALRYAGLGHLAGMDKSEVTRLIERKIQQMPPTLPVNMRISNLRIDEELDLGVLDDYDPGVEIMTTSPGSTESAVRWYEDIHRVNDRWTETDEVAGDSLVPAQVLGVEVFGRTGLLLVKWDTVPNTTMVKYNVHISTTSGFTPDDTNRVAQTGGTLVFIRALPDGTALSTGTTYYIKVTAEDIDGVGTASTEVSGAPTTNNDSTDLLVGTVTAEQLEAVMVLTNTLIAGAEDGGRVEIGFGTGMMSSMVGIHAFASDGETNVFMLNAQNGDVFIKGRVDFGSGSRLTDEDIIEIKRQPIGFLVPNRVQTTSTFGIGSTASAAWPSPTTKGNLLLAMVFTREVGGAVTHNTPGGWSAVSNVANGEVRLSLYKIENAASRSGTQNIGFSDPTDWAIALFEYSGVQLEDVSDANTGTGKVVTAGPTTTTTQAEELWFAVGGLELPHFRLSDDQVGGFTKVSETVVGGPWPAHYGVMATYEKIVTATGTPQIEVLGNHTNTGCEWVGIVAAFKAKSAAIEPPDGDVVRLYAKDVAGKDYLHTKNSDSQAGAIVLGAADQVWRMEYIEIAGFDPVGLGAHGDNTHNVTVNGVNVGDLIIYLGAIGNQTVWSRYVKSVDPVCSTANQVTFWLQNADDATVDAVGVTLAFIIIHRS